MYLPLVTKCHRGIIQIYLETNIDMLEGSKATVTRYYFKPYTARWNWIYVDFRPKFAINNELWVKKY